MNKEAREVFEIKREPTTKELCWQKYSDEQFGDWSDVTHIQTWSNGFDGRLEVRGVKHSMTEKPNCRERIPHSHGA